MSIKILVWQRPYITEQWKNNSIQCRSTLAARQHRSSAAAQTTSSILGWRCQMASRGDVRNTAAAHHHHSAVAAVHGAVIAWTVWQWCRSTVAIVAIHTWMLLRLLRRIVSSISLVGTSQARSSIFDFVRVGWWGGGCWWDAVREMSTSIQVAVAATTTSAVRSSVVQWTYLFKVERIC